jgi:hypothetical protein
MKPVDIINAVGAKACRKYSDAIVGGRSFKIPSWTKEQYEQARLLAIENGFDSRVLVTPKLDYVRGPFGGEMRIHIKAKKV